MSNHNTHSGIAALTICEALLLALNDANILPEKDILGILKDAATTHENATDSSASGKEHEAVAQMINRIISGGNSVRRP